MLVVGIVFLLGAFVGFSEDVATGFVGLLVAGGILAGAIFWLKSCKAGYHVAISSASGEAHALTSKDKAYIEKVVASINDAIIRYQ